MQPQVNWHVPVLVLILMLIALWSLTVGAASLPLADVIEALITPDGTTREVAILWSVRLPRLLVAIVVGSALAVAGSVIQAATANPLADPGLLGINAGAAFAVVMVTIIHGPGMAVSSTIWPAFGGAALTAAIVYGLGAMGRSGPTPVKLILAGVVVNTFLVVVITSVLILDLETLDAVRRWTAGSLQGRTVSEVLAVAPYIGVGLLLAMLLRDRFTTLSLGSDTSRGLGQNTAVWRLISAIIVVLLAGSAVAIAGPLGFVGLVVPHIARLLVGADYRQILPFSVVAGSILTLLADVLPRALWRNDIPVGISMAVVGAPFFIWLARRS